MKKKIAKYLKAAFSVVLLFYLFYYMIDFRNLITILRNVNPAYILLSFVSLILSFLAASYRWQYVIKMKNKDISFRASAREFLIGAFFNNFLPGSIGGDVMRIAGAAKEIGSKEIAFSSVFVERVIGLISLIAIGLIGFMYLNIGSGAGYLGISVILLSTLFTGLFVMIYPKTNSALCELLKNFLPARLSDFLLSYIKDFSGYSSSPYKLFIVFLISFGFKIFDGFFIYFVFLSLGVGLTYAHALALFSVINVIKMIPISFNGLGLSAISWVFLMRTFGTDENVAASIDFLTITISLIISVYGGILYFQKTNRKNPV